MNRREILSVLGSGSVVGFAGCTSFFEEEDTTVELLGVRAVNWIDELTAVDVRVAHEGEVVEEATFEFSEHGQSQLLDCTWPAEPGDFVVSARLEDDNEWKDREFADPEVECGKVLVMVDHPTEPPSMPTSTNCERSWC